MGGRASRLDGAAKGDLRVGGRTLLELVVAAAGVARERVVIGDAGASVLPPEVRVVREDPPFGGPAAAVAAGVHELADDADAVLLLASLVAQRDLSLPELLDRYELYLYKQWLRVYMRSKMIKHNKDLFESLDDPMALLEKLHIY